MAERQVDLESIIHVTNLLGTYISEVNRDIQKMQHAAIDCSDNMGNDELSRRAIDDLEECTQELSKTTIEAENLRKEILKQITMIEQLKGGH